MSQVALDHYLRVRSINQGREADPLRYWRWGVERLKEAFSLFARGKIRELHCRACNKGTKTETVAAFVLACCRKLKTLDGVPLPQWRGPVEAAQFVLDYKLELLSVQAAYLRLIGNHPHNARYQGEYLSTLHVMPEGGDPDNEADWSVLHFISQKNPQAGVGARADIAAFDEPPLMPVLREMRKAAHAGRLGIIIIGETPTVMSRWVELREDYGECPRRSIRIVDEDRAEVRWSLDEVADWILSPQEKDALRRSYAREPYLRDAREHGDYSVTEGQHPFDVETLLVMLKECRDPEIIPWKVQREKLADEMAKVVVVDVECWGEPEIGASYYFPLDPASGVQDKSHNPLAILGAKRGPGDLKIRYNGRIAPYSLGRLAAGIGRQYNVAPVDIEMNDHWGVNVYRGLQDSHYPNIAHERKKLGGSEFSNEIGFKADAKGKKLAVGEIQNWISAYAAGIRYAACPSRRVIEAIMDCVLDEDGKVVPGRDLHGGHGEDVVLWGRILSRAVTTSGRRVQPIYEAPKTRTDKLMEEIMSGAKPANGVPYGGIPKPRMRPR